MTEHAAVPVDLRTLPKWLLHSMSIVAAAIATYLVVIVFYALGMLFGRTSELAQLLMLRHLTIIFGMLLGAGCIFLGVALTWAGVTATLRMGATHETTQFTFATASPGVTAIFCGTSLIAMALWQQATFVGPEWTATLMGRLPKSQDERPAPPRLPDGPDSNRVPPPSPPPADADPAAPRKI